MGSAPSTAKSVEVFQVRNELQEQLEVTKKELKNQLVAATKQELQEHLKATKEELKKQSEATKKELNNQLVTVTKKELQENLKVAKDELKKQSEKTMKDLKEVLEYKLEIKELERKNIELSGEKAELEKQLQYARKAALVLMDAADAYQEATEKQTKAKMEELEDTRKAALVIMEAADTYQEATEREIKAQTEDLENTRNAALVFMDAADTYQEAAERQIKSKVEELEDMRMVSVDAAACACQEAAEKQIKATVQTLQVLEGQEAMRVESLESVFNATLANNQEMEVDVTVKKRECDLVKGENNMFQSEVLATEPKPNPNLFEARVETKLLKMELGGLVEAEAGANAFEAEMEDIMKEPKDLKEEIKTIKGLVMHENEMLWSEDFIAEQKYDIYEVEVETTEMQLTVLTEAKEPAETGFNVKEAKIMKELEEIHAIRDS